MIEISSGFKTVEVTFLSSYWLIIVVAEPGLWVKQFNQLADPLYSAKPVPSDFGWYEIKIKKTLDEKKILAEHCILGSSMFAGL